MFEALEGFAVDGTASLADAAIPTIVADAVVTLRVARDSRDRASDLVVVRAEARFGGCLAGHDEFAGRSFREVHAGLAAELLHRLEAAAGGTVELRIPDDQQNRVHLLTAHHTGDGDTWTVTVDPLVADPSVDARLREINHRVLNSLAMLSSIIGFESRALRDDAGRAALERVRSRLVAVSNLYRILGTSESGDRIRADLYLTSVTDAVAASVGLGERIGIRVDAAPCELTTSQAASVGLIANEAMTNAYKHAFAGRRDGRITVALQQVGDRLLLSVSDNGTGMPERAQSGLGTTLIEALATDLSGRVSVASDESGTSLRVEF